MRLAIMQPYFFPYLGYFQLIKAVDKFLIYDDVNFIKQGWITRNRILLEEKEFKINLQVLGGSSFKKINEISVGSNRRKVLKTIGQAYRRASMFDEVFPIIQEILMHDNSSLSGFLHFSLKRLTAYLGISTELQLSSELVKNNYLKGQEKVLEICKICQASAYINAFGGQSLYDREAFAKHNIELRFIVTGDIKYKQFSNEFKPGLSIVDVMMFNTKERIGEFLNNYHLK